MDGGFGVDVFYHKNLVVAVDGRLVGRVPGDSAENALTSTHRYLASKLNQALQRQLFVKIGITVGQFQGLGPTGIKLQIMLFRESYGTVALMGRLAYAVVGAADPGFGHGDRPLCSGALGYLPGRLVDDIAGSFQVGGHVGAVVLDRLEAAGLIQRVPNPEDRRSLLIRLSDEGQKVLLGCLDEYLATLHEMQAPLDVQQKQALAAGLRTLLLALEEGHND